MSDGHETPPGWSAEQPPPYQAPGSPYSGQGPSAWQQPAPPPPPPGQQPHSQPPHGQPPYGQPGYGPQGYGPQGYGYAPPPALRPGIIPLRPLGLGDIYDGTIKLIRSNPKSVLGLSAIVAAIAAIPVSIGQALAFSSFGAIMSDPTAANADALESGGFLSQTLPTIISSVVSLVAVTILTGVIIRILGRAVFGGKITAGEAWRLVASRVPALFGVILLIIAIMLVPAVPIALIIVAVAANGSAGAAVGLGALFLILYIGYMLFINTRLSFAAPAVVLEGLGPVQALRRSWRLVSGDFWRVLGILLLTMIIVYVVSMVLSFPFGLIAGVVSVMGGGSTGATILVAVVFAIGTTLGAMITYPLQAGVTGLLYTDRRMRSEAFDLVLQTAALEQQRQGWVHASADELWHPSNARRP
ncbi:glycerophosphoryl diester phosphodiesterase membrane domain-containing protein [Nonomuraea sp. NPDC059194]|uniref:glycerophosphoryl diester phosphodiesterase membrane domain-containing protein n=1 Tax=Nonomuraea sp. NPDC059194 TaxID=3346764 RepID=UPI00368C1AF3